MPGKLRKKHYVSAGIIISFLMGTTMLSAQKVPVSFDAYHGYTGTTEYLKKVSAAYPGITELMTIGESTMGRPIHVLVISNMNRGTTIDRHIDLRNKRRENIGNVPEMKIHQGKPGHFISGATHGNEYTGTEVCLYIIDKLVSSYGNDETITGLVDSKAFYICPAINPDGLYNSVEKGIAQRNNSMLVDDDEDGRINEDGPDDIDGDGFITSFRYPDEEGMYVIDDEDPRLMIRLGRDEETDKQRYSVIREALDNDGDGRIGEDSESGIDLNRNYPEGWWKDDGFAGGSGDYPLSAPETHAIAEFFTTYRNILMAQFYHTSGGFTYRPMGTAPHSRLNPADVAVFDFIMGRKYLEIIGEEVPEAWLHPEKTDQYRKELQESDADSYSKSRGYVLPRGWRVSYDEQRDRRYSYGMATDWLYAQYGIWSITTELWNPAADIPGLEVAEDAENRRTALERALLDYQDRKYDGRLFREWKAFRHPQLGEGETGGWISQYARNNAFPGEPLLDVCEKHWQFELFRATLLPEIQIKDLDTNIIYTGNTGEASVEKNNDGFRIESGKGKSRYRIMEITATIENTGKLATNLADGEDLPGNRQDVAWLVAERDNIEFIEGQPVVKLGSLGGTEKIPGVKSLPSKKEVKWIVAVKDNTGLKIVVSSLKGGSVFREINIK
ncbi:MAG: M14 family metallopeptidase [Bacteroidota bacterium]